MSPLPRLELVRVGQVFEEAVICIDGHEEETITIECPGAAELAERLVELVNTARGDVVDVPRFLKSEER